MNATGSANVDILSLQRLYKSGTTAALFLDNCARRKYNFRVSTADRLVRKLNATRADAVGLLQRLHELGCGLFVVGRRGSVSRLEWSVSSITVGKVARGELSEVEPLGAGRPLVDEEAGDDEPLDEGIDGEPVKLIEHSFRLRPNLIVTPKLPGDLTVGEAARLADFLRTLPLDRGGA